MPQARYAVPTGVRFRDDSPAAIEATLARLAARARALADVALHQALGATVARYLDWCALGADPNLAPSAFMEDPAPGFLAGVRSAPLATAWMDLVAAIRANETSERRLHEFDVRLGFRIFPRDRQAGRLGIVQGFDGGLTGALTTDDNLEPYGTTPSVDFPLEITEAEWRRRDAVWARVLAPRSRRAGDSARWFVDADTVNLMVPDASRVLAAMPPLHERAAYWARERTLDRVARELLTSAARDCGVSLRELPVWVASKAIGDARREVADHPQRSGLVKDRRAVRALLPAAYTTEAVHSGYDAWREASLDAAPSTAAPVGADPHAASTARARPLATPGRRP